MKTTESTLDLLYKLGGYFIGWWLVAASLLWFNHVLYHAHLTYWQWLPLAAVFIIVKWCYKFLDKIFGFLTFVILIIQILSWMHVVHTPIW
jgi:hypothetical protein